MKKAFTLPIILVALYFTAEKAFSSDGIEESNSTELIRNSPITALEESPFASFNLDVLMHMLSFLDNDSLLQMSSTCSYFRTELNSPYVRAQSLKPYTITALYTRIYNIQDVLGLEIGGAIEYYCSESIYASKNPYLYYGVFKDFFAADNLQLVTYEYRQYLKTALFPAEAQEGFQRGIIVDSEKAFKAFIITSTLSKIFPSGVHQNGAMGGNAKLLLAISRQSIKSILELKNSLSALDRLGIRSTSGREYALRSLLKLNGDGPRYILIRKFSGFIHTYADALIGEGLSPVDTYRLLWILEHINGGGHHMKMQRAL